MLTDLFAKIKSFLKSNQRDLSLALLVFLTSIASFGLGRLSTILPEKKPIQIEKIQDSGFKIQESASVGKSISESGFMNLGSAAAGNFVASKNGSSYHLPTCPGAKQIKQENKIWFKTAEEARRAGYKPAGNCQGL